MLLKFNLWARWFFPQYFKFEDAPFHRTIDRWNLSAYRGTIRTFTDIVFRGGANSAMVRCTDRRGERCAYQDLKLARSLS